jgi:hypothetical protein
MRPGESGARLGADAQPRRQFFGRAADGIFDRARAGRADHGEADEEGARGDGGGGFVRRASAQCNAPSLPRMVEYASLFRPYGLSP